MQSMITRLVAMALRCQEPGGYLDRLVQALEGIHAELSQMRETAYAEYVERGGR